jgi:hypothetical protein
VYGQFHLASRKRSRLPAPPDERRGAPALGRIVELLVGQGTGFIRFGVDSKAFFHRGDLQPDTSINDFELGDAVEFELVEDRVSGPRAVRVRRCFAIGSDSV